MGKQSKRLLAMLLAFVMTVTSLTFNTSATNVADIVNDAEKVAEEVTGDADKAAKEADDSDQAEAKAKKSSSDEKSESKSDSTEIDVDIDTKNLESNVALAKAETKGMDENDLDMSDPEMQAVAQDLETQEVTDTEGEKVGLTDDQKQQVLNLYQQYLDYRTEHADVLGAQAPFYLSFNDDNEDGLGILGEMLVLAGVSVDDVRNGNYSYDDLNGMILNFLYGDQFGVEYYGDKVESQRDAALKAVEDSGAKSKVQQLLVLNDWLGQQNTFDMAYIMNSSGTASMEAEEPVENEHYDEIYQTIYGVYKPRIEAQFQSQFRAVAEQQVGLTIWQNAIKSAVAQQYQAENPDATEEEVNAYAEQYMTDNADAIAADPRAYVVEHLGGEEVAAQMEEQVNGYLASEDGQAAVEQAYTVIMDTEIPDLGNMTPNQAIEVYTQQAATGLTDGIIGYWQGTQIGALALGSSVCMGYSKAYTYLVQCLDADYFTKTGNYADASDWKTTDELYYTDGKIDIDKGYTVDMVRISYDASVTMYGETQDNFNSDHFWNAVRVDGKWYYADPCYIDVYTEVMSRDRVEVNGSMNHMYFLFSDDTARELYDGNFSAIIGLYEDAADNKDYEDAWVSRIKSNTYFDGTNAYYVYDSTDLISLLEDYNNNSGNASDIQEESENAKFKIVKHAMTDTDTGDGDADYEALIEFNYKENDDDDTSVARVYNPETQAMEENEELTSYYAQYLDQKSIYPSITLTMGYKDGMIYFNLANAIFSYNTETGDVVLVKEYNDVYAERDKTIAFGGMAFKVVDSASDSTLAVENAPIAGLTLKPDGNFYIDIATNYAYISGKSDIEDSSSTGYEFQESNYNPNYNSYISSQGIDMPDDMLEQMGYKREKNDNDEFMWTAVFTDTIAESTISGSHDYEKVTVDAACGRDAYTENRCKDCGVTEAGTREYIEGTAEDHHYVHFDETYYTKDSDGNWNTNDCYVCTSCGYAVEPDDDGTDEDWDASKDTYEMAKEKAGHVYTAADESKVEWAEDYSSATITDADLTCNTCIDKKLDCLLNADDLTLSGQTVTLTDVTKTTSGTCDEGLTITYTATGKTDDGKAVEATTVVNQEGGKHAYDATFTWAEDNSSATVDLKCPACGKELTGQEATVTQEETEATCEDEGKIVYTATFTPEDGDAVTDTKTVKTSDALGHDYSEPVFTWADDNKTATAEFTCGRCDKKETVDAKVTEDTSNSSATCTEAGEVVYTATVEFEGKEYTDTKTVEVEALGHNYSDPVYTWTWLDDEKTELAGSASFTCERCGDKQTVDLDLTSEITKDATYVAKGAKVYTAAYEFDGKPYEVTKQVSIKKLDADAKLTKSSVSLYATARTTLDLSSEYDADEIVSISTKPNSKIAAAAICRENKGLRIAGKAEGSTSVKVTTASNETITVKIKIKTPTVKLNATSAPLKVKQSTTAIKVSSMIATDEIKSVRSSKTDVVTVKKTSDTGLQITAKNKVDSATVAVFMRSGARAKVRLHVQKSTVAVTSVSVDTSKVTLRLGGDNKKTTHTIAVTLKPVTATSSISYSSSNTNVAIVNRTTGKIRAKKAGTATVTVKSGSKSKKITVTVKNQ